MSDTAIRVENLSKQYRIGLAQQRSDTLRDALAGAWHSLRRRRERRAAEAFWALRDVSFEVQRGEVVGVIGRNGAGKSTLLKILSQITEPTRGRAEIYGRVGSLLEVGTGFHPELTGRENIFLSGAMLGMRREEIQRKFDEIVDFSGVETFIDTPIKRYSSGMNVRLGFAVAAHLEPEILLVDEVLAVGDAAFQKKCLGKMGDVAKHGRTVLFVSHNMTAVQGLCQRVLVLEQGAVSYEGAVAAGVTSYLGILEPGSTVSEMRRSPDSRIPVVKDVKVTVCGRQDHGNRLDIGESFEVTMVLDAPAALHSANVGIGINGPTGARVTTLLTRNQFSAPLRLQSEAVVTCRVPQLNLAPGVYDLKLAIGEGNEDIDIVEVAAAFEVLPTDIWHTGRLPNVTQGVVVTAAEWRFDDRT